MSNRDYRSELGKVMLTGAADISKHSQDADIKEGLIKSGLALGVLTTLAYAKGVRCVEGHDPVEMVRQVVLGKRNILSRSEEESAVRVLSEVIKSTPMLHYVVDEKYTSLTHYMSRALYFSIKIAGVVVGSVCIGVDVDGDVDRTNAFFALAGEGRTVTTDVVGKLYDQVYGNVA